MSEKTHYNIMPDQFREFIWECCPFTKGWQINLEGSVTSETFGNHHFTCVYLAEDAEHIFLKNKTEGMDIPLYKIATEAQSVSISITSALKIPIFAQTAKNIIIQERVASELKRREDAKKIKAEKKKKLMDELSPSLEKLDFISLDKKFKNLSSVDPDLFYEVKAERIAKFLEERISPILANDIEKALVLVHATENKLVKARAGSGKTTVLGAQTVLLAEGYGVKPDEILILAFNRTASQEIGSRIREQYGFVGFHQARTFHSLAYAIVRPEEELLFDEDRSFYGEKQKNFIYETVRSIWEEKNLETRMMIFFRKELVKIKDHGGDLSQDEYLIFRRNKRDVTLGGDFVKSFGEKIIADFFFEHDIHYRYEDRVFVKGEDKDHLGSIYKPDFTIFFKRKIIRLEHWGIDENDPRKQVSDDWSGTWDDYHEKMKWKRDFWKGRKETLLETSIVDIRNGREKFEEKISQLLIAVGIEPVKLSDRELAKKLFPIHRDRMTNRFAQFIQRAKKTACLPNVMRKKIEDGSPLDLRTQTFLELACDVYEKYEERKNKDNNPEKKNYIDFDDLLIKAAEQVRQENGKCLVNLSGQGKGLPITLNNLRYIFIDEYQDYSELFHSLVSAMQKNNSKLQVSAVGDDWQAINSFAGSNLRYFHNFNEYFPESTTGNMLINHRSQKTIVDFGNDIMRDFGGSARYRSGNEGGYIYLEYVDDVWLNLPNKTSAEPNEDDDTKFVFRRPHGELDFSRMLVSQYLRKCSDIILDNESSSILVLSRRRVLPYGVRLSEFSQKLRRCLPKSFRTGYDKKIKVTTAHSSKGQEADIVIVLRAVNGEFPLIHPDGELFRIFGQSVQDELQEERRLFYVACSRAKSKLYLLTERGEVSDFIPSKYKKTDIRVGQEEGLKTAIHDDLDDELPF